MAGLNGTEMSGAGPLGAFPPQQAKPGLAGDPLARRQYAALAAMRWQMFLNSLRSAQGAFELGARTLGFLFYSLVGLGVGLGMGVGAYAIVSYQMWTFLPLILWALLILWQALPLALASLQEGFEVNGLLRFPVSFASFFLLNLVFGLIDVSTVVGGMCSFAIWAGITAARPGMFAWAALGLGLFALFNILLARTLFAWIERWLAQRRTREIAGAVFFLLLLCLQLLNPAFQHTRTAGAVSAATKAARRHRLATTGAVQAWLPPGLAARALERAGEARPAPALGFTAVLGLYALATGSLLTVRLRAEYRGENLGESRRRKSEAPQRKAWLPDGSDPVQPQQAKIGLPPQRAKIRLTGDPGLPPQQAKVRLAGGPGLFGGPVAAVMEKELRILLRSLPLLYALVVPLVMVFVFGGIAGLSYHGSASRPRLALMFPLFLAYLLMHFVALTCNNLGGEETGIQLYFLFSTPIRTVLKAKNLFHALIFGLEAVLMGILAGFRFGWPSAVVLEATVAWLLFALPVQLAMGNILSLCMPYRRNLGRIMRQRRGQGNALLSMLMQVPVVGLGVAVFWLCSSKGVPGMAAPVFLLLAGGAVLLWLRVLSNADAMANQRREALVATLAKVE